VTGTVAVAEQKRRVAALDVGTLGPRQATYPIVRIHLLGSMRATTCFGDNLLPRSKKTRALLGYLCLAPGGKVSRAHLTTLLWDCVPAVQARPNFRQALKELISAFGSLANELISVNRETLKLNLDACWVDALAASTSTSSSDDSSRRFAALCRDELLEELEHTSASFDRWLLEQRARLGQRMRSLLEEEHTGSSSGTLAVGQAVPTASHRRDQVGPAASTLQGFQSSANCGRLRVGVLPFLADHSTNKENLAFSLSQEIAAGLGRFRWFDVIAPVSLRRTLSAGFVGCHQHEHGDFDYVVDGAVSGQGKHFQISVRLIDLADRAYPVWGERFDIAMDQLHRLDELVTARIVARIDPVILHIEGRPKRRDRYGATGLLLLAIPMIFSMERKKYEEAGRLIDRALELEPNNAMVEAWAAHWHIFYIGQGWARDVDQANATAQQHAVKAIKLDPANAEALGIYAHTCSIVNKDFDTALQYFDRSLRLNPSLAFIWALSAATYCYIGEPDIALQRLERYRELAPLDPYFSWFETIYTIAYTFKGDYERAVLVGRRTVKAHPDFVAGYKPLVASLGHLNRRDEAQPYVQKLLSLDPTFTVESFGRIYCIKKSSDRERYMAGLRLAGIPER